MTEDKTNLPVTNRRCHRRGACRRQKLAHGATKSAAPLRRRAADCPLCSRVETYVRRHRGRGCARSGIAGSAGNLGAGRSRLSGTGRRNLLWVKGGQRRILFRDFLRCRFSQPGTDFAPYVSDLASTTSWYPFGRIAFSLCTRSIARSVLPLLKGQFDRGELRPIYLFDKVRTCKIDEDVIRRFDPEGLSFLNMNTPDDYAARLAALERAELFRSRTGDELVQLHGRAFRHGPDAREDQNGCFALPHQAPLSPHVFSELAEKLPILVGRVITPEKNQLVSGCACNVNGLDFVRNATAKVKTGDRILILSADAGG